MAAFAGWRILIPTNPRLAHIPAKIMSAGGDSKSRFLTLCYAGNVVEITVNSLLSFYLPGAQAGTLAPACNMPSFRVIPQFACLRRKAGISSWSSS